jgi:hypothetical protein
VAVGDLAVPLAVATVVSVLVACGSAGRARTEAPVLNDVDALRQAIATGRSTEVSARLNGLLLSAQTRPGDREGWKGTALIRDRLPRIVELFGADYARTRPRLSRLQMRTSAGAALKALLLRSYDTRRRRLLGLQADVASGSYVWGDVLRWIGKNNAEVAVFDRRLGAILATLTPAERQAVERLLAR